METSHSERWGEAKTNPTLATFGIISNANKCPCITLHYQYAKNNENNQDDAFRKHIGGGARKQQITFPL